LLTNPNLKAANELRGAAGRTLGWLGDPREDVNCPVPALVLIPAGPFLMGSDEASDKLAYDREEPQHTVTLPAYRIGRYPVTVAQYRPFVAGDGYENEAYWTAAGWQWRRDENIVQPGYWDDPQLTVPNHPVVGISWYEAAAYCAWLSAQTGKVFRLPDEALWEKAARGTDGRIYPWGNDWDPTRLNSGQVGIGQTSAVGIFPGGRSPFGIYDASGNVWEWCSNKGYVKYLFNSQPYRQEIEGNARRGLRGGAFLNDAVIVRTAYRYDGGYPNLRSNYVGFRVVEHLP
jgi:formylglycine-generating enzyme required for sulfatase activity